MDRYRIVAFCFFLRALQKPINGFNNNQKTQEGTNQWVYILFTYDTFFIKCPRHTSRSNSKFESAPTVMYCNLSSFIHKTRKLSVAIYTHCSLAIWLRSFTKWVLQKQKEKRKERNLVNKSSMHKFKRKFLKCWLALQWFHVAALHGPAYLKPESRDVSHFCLSLRKMYLCRHKWIKFPLFQKVNDNQNVK